jgi:hypothetical protein
MPRDFYPRREADIVSFTSNFGSRVTTDPEAFGLTPEMVAGYMDLQRAFVACYFTVHAPSSNSSSAYAAKKAARVKLEAATRPLVSRVRATLAVTDGQRALLGLKPRPVRRRHVPAPEGPPYLRVRGAVGRMLRIELSDRTSLRRGIPRDVDGATILGYVGDFPPANADQWELKGHTSRATTAVRFDNALPPGTKVWLIAHWFNRRCERGPNCAPVYTHLPYGATMRLGLAQRAA